MGPGWKGGIGRDSGGQCILGEGTTGRKDFVKDSWGMMLEI